MAFNILYVEDLDTDFLKLQGAVAHHNDMVNAEHDHYDLDLHVERAKDIKEVQAKLQLCFDVILCDVYLPESPGDRPKDRLKEVIDIVKDWSSRRGLGRPIPIIAFTGFGQDALNRCLNHKVDLYDIWDKNSASMSYAAWRLSKLAIELARVRPDSAIRNLILDLPDTQVALPSFHEKVKQMLRAYDEGYTEVDQIKKTSHHIHQMARDFDELSVCNDMWGVMEEWESLGLAASHKIRGHARHVMNVFWLGYILLHKSSLKDWFAERWEELKDNRKSMGVVKGLPPLQAMTNAWFYASLFHDAAGCVEKAMDLAIKQQKILNVYDNDCIKFSTPVLSEAMKREVDELLGELDENIRGMILPRWEKSLAEGKPDHGMMAALHLRQGVHNPQQKCLAREASRAMALHNIFPLVGTANTKLSWEQEPLACLLMFCDQVQAWDRERGGENQFAHFPQRAELDSLQIGPRHSAYFRQAEPHDDLAKREGDVVQPPDIRPELRMSINYIAPRHLWRNPDLFNNVKTDLEKVITDYPDKALRLLSDWPFTAQIECALSGNSLSTTMEFGNIK
jgi:CheY-like chemotaxis protein